jgi:hypothetical protein
MVLKNALPWAGGAIGWTLTAVAVLGFFGLALSNPPRVAIAAYLGAVLLVALGEGAYRTWKQVDDDLQRANQKLEAEHSRENLAARLDTLAREAGLLRSEIPADDLPPDVERVRAEYALVEEMNDLNRRALRELRIYAPEHMEFFKQDAPSLDARSFNSSPIPRENFERWMDFTVGQLRHISGELRGEQ